MKKVKFISLSAFLFIHIILYILIYGFKLFDIDTENLIDYFIIISCFLFSFINLIIKKNKYTLIFFIAFLFTLIADTFLLLLDKNYEIGVFSFLIVQICYFLYILIKMYSKNTYILHILTRLSTLLIGIITCLFVDKKDMLISFLCITYISNLALNIIISFTTKNKNILFTIGLIMFLLCDICVGFSNLNNIYEISTNSFIYLIATSSINWSWFFYHPSQVLLVITEY